MANKVALVTGAQAGIGAACAKRLARDGIAIGVLDLNEAICAETVAAIKAAGGEAIALGADIADRTQVKAAVAKLRDAFGPVTIVVNNVGSPISCRLTRSPKNAGKWSTGSTCSARSSLRRK